MAFHTVSPRPVHGNRTPGTRSRKRKNVRIPGDRLRHWCAARAICIRSGGTGFPWGIHERPGEKKKSEKNRREGEKGRSAAARLQGSERESLILVQSNAPESVPSRTGRDARWNGGTGIAHESNAALPGAGSGRPDPGTDAKKSEESEEEERRREKQRRLKRKNTKLYLTMELCVYYPR